MTGFSTRYLYTTSKLRTIAAAANFLVKVPSAYHYHRTAFLDAVSDCDVAFHKKKDPRAVSRNYDRHVDDNPTNSGSVGRSY